MDRLMCVGCGPCTRLRCPCLKCEALVAKRRRVANRQAKWRAAHPAT